MTNPQPSSGAAPSLVELRGILQQLESIAAYKRDYGCVFYTPIGNQGKFHACNDKVVRLVLGSNRSGKTASGTVEAIAHALGYRPWLAPDHPDYIVRLPSGEPIPTPNVGRVVAENFAVSIQQTIVPSFQEWGRKLITHVKRDQRQVPVRLTFYNGSIIYLMSYDQDDMVFEGTKGHWAWFDEPPPYAKYIAVKRGLVDYGGRVWITMTPISQPWINDVIVARAGEPGASVEIFRYSIWHNARSNGGYLPDDAIKEFLADLREEELEARLHGNFLHLAGRVFKEWNPEAPFYKDLGRTWDRYPAVCIIDPHPRKPIAVTWIAVTPDNQYLVYRDLFDQKLNTVGDVARKMRELEGWVIREAFDGTWTARPTDAADTVCLYIIDTSANASERTSGDTVKKAFARFGIHCVDAVKHNIESGLDSIHQALKIRGEWGEPGLIVDLKCRNVKNNFMFFCYDDWRTSRDRDLREPKQEPRKIHDDFIACIRYAYQKGVTYGMLMSAHSRNRPRYEEVTYGEPGAEISARRAIYDPFGGNKHTAQVPKSRPVTGYPGLVLRGN